MSSAGDTRRAALTELAVRGGLSDSERRPRSTEVAPPFFDVHDDFVQASPSPARPRHGSAAAPHSALGLRERHALLPWLCAALSVFAAGLAGVVFAVASLRTAASPGRVLPVAASASMSCGALERAECAGTGSWWSGGVIYQVYVRSFQDSDGDGVGDLRGIQSRLDYLASLNISGIWLSPVYPSPMKDFGYDVSDFTDVHSLFGTLEDLDALVAAAHERGIRVLLDLVPNHTSDAHPWFVESASSRTSPKRDWYVWVDAPAEGNSSGAASRPPNDWLSFFGGSAWTWDTNTRAWYLHQYLPEQPDLNWRNPQVRAALANVMRFWQRRGVDGFRIDSLPTLLEDALLRDEAPNPAWRPGMDPHDAQLHLRSTQDVDPLHAVVHQLRAVADERSSVLVCETNVGLNELQRFYGPRLHECQLPFNFGLVSWRADWNATRLRGAIVSYLSELPPGATATFVLANHDNSRVATRLGGQRKARAALTLLMSLPGTPTVYNGEELGALDVALSEAQVRDPAALRQPRVLWPLVGRDPERAPLAWTGDQPHAGFLPPSAPPGVQPWLPLPPDWRTNNAAQQSGNETSTLSLFRALAALRRGEPALRGAPLVVLELGDDVLAFVRPLRCRCGPGARPAPGPASSEDLPEADIFERPPAGAKAFVFALNMGAQHLTLDVGAALRRAGLAADLLLPPGRLQLVLDSDAVTTHAGELLASSSILLAPWQARLLSMPLQPRGTAAMGGG